MEKLTYRILFDVSLIFGLCILCGCSIMEDHVVITQGNYAFGIGNYQDAYVLYLQADTASEYADIVSYNLGNVYKALGETEAAYEEWKSIIDSNPEDDQLLFRVHYNKGILLYETGNYQDAYTAFRKALEYQPNDRRGKINLEHCILKLNSQPPAQAAVKQEADTETEGAERILEYIHRKEEIGWQVPPDGSEESPENDW